MTLQSIELFFEQTDLGFSLIAVAILGVEILKGLFAGTFKKQRFLDMIANISTQIPSVLIEIFLFSSVYAGFVLFQQAFISWTLPLTIPVIILAMIACDFAYYWEHRIAHRVRLFWTQHAVHHSSREMNVSVSIRFGPLEGVIATLVHFPLLLLGIPAELILIGMIIILSYQGWIHTELIGKLPILDEFLNTPANHRVHHGCDEKYIDKNYGGVLIIWDRLFGTYQREEETPRYGLKRDFESVNPLVVWFSELPQFFRDVAGARTWSDALGYIFLPPGWKPEETIVPAKSVAKE